MVSYRIIQAIVRFFLFFVFRIKVYGRENIPKEGGVMVASNHRSNWDPVILGAYSLRKLNFMAKSELFKNKVLGKLITALGAFPIHRGRGDLGAVKAALTMLRAGNAVAIFPEGRRVKDNEKIVPKPGAVMLAVKAQVPVLPVRIVGKYRWFSKINVYFGKPVEYTEYYDEKLMVDTLQGLSDGLMSKIRSMDSENFNS
ncbi:MAG: lysophospholipid acyltransferase family protein [Clostridia bacterium]|nr:lysophospholipid acyltransferase family protein [Clostridia bacterium]